MAKHYPAVINLPPLFKEKSSNHHKDFYCLNCINSYTTKNKLKEHEEICNNHNSCDIEIPKWVKKILKYNPGEKSLQAPLAIYLDLESLLKKNNLVKIIILIIKLIISKNLTQKKKLSMSLLVGQYLQNVHLMKKKINLIIVEEKIVLKNYVKS